MTLSQLDEARVYQPVELLWTAFCDRGIPEGQFQTFTLYYVAMRNKFASEFVLCDTPEEAYELFGDIVRRIGTRKFRAVIEEVASDLEDWAWQQLSEQEAESLKSEEAKKAEEAMHARAIAKPKEDTGLLETGEQPEAPIPADLYPPLYKTAAERVAGELDQRLKQLTSITKRADENYESWEWDENTPPAWVNAFVIKRDASVEDHFHKFSKSGQCDPAEDAGEPSGCRWKQFNPDMPCVHEMAFQKEMARRIEMIRNPTSVVEDGDRDVAPKASDLIEGA